LPMQAAREHSESEADDDADAASGASDSNQGSDADDRTEDGPTEDAPTAPATTTEPPPGVAYTASPRVGETAVTQVYDRTTHLTPDTPATLRAEGSRIVVYVEDAVYGSLIDDEQLNHFVQRFEALGNAEGHDPALGVLALNEAVFAPLRAELYSDGKLSVFIVDTHDSGDGYLCSWCDEPSLHLDAPNLAPIDGDLALSISAHESFHAIHRGYDVDESIWIDESLAEAAMVVNGFFTDVEVFAQYLSQPNINWGPGVADIGGFHYGAGLAFGSYLWEQGGVALMQAMTTEPLDSWQGLDAALRSIGDSRTGLELFIEMGLALHYDAPDRGFGFEGFVLPGQVPTKRLAAGTEEQVTLQPYGLVYFTHDEDVQTLRVDGSSDIRAVLATDTDPITVTEITLGSDVVVSEAGVLMITATGEASASVTAL
jgi:hypothetical protein